jgi:hypothetical protein
MKNHTTLRSFCNRVLFGIGAFAFVASGTLSAQTYNQIKKQHPDWVQIPGELIRPDCVHDVPNGASIDLANSEHQGDDVILDGQVIAHYEACPEDPIDTRTLGSQNQRDPGPTGNGWVEASQWLVSLKSGDNLDVIEGFWIVPSPPKTNGATIFLFNGVEPANGSNIMQPVLQYGGSKAGGGNYWAIASWLVGNNAYFSPLESVNPGDLLFGFTEQTGNSGGKLHYLVKASDIATGAYSSLGVSSTGIQWNWAFAGVLEAYNVTSCSEYPTSGSTQFFNSEVAHGYPSFDYYSSLGFQGHQWDYFGNGGPQCNFKVSLVDGGFSSTLQY